MFAPTSEGCASDACGAFDTCPHCAPCSCWHGSEAVGASRTCCGCRPQYALLSGGNSQKFRFGWQKVFPLGAGAGVPHDHTMCHTHAGMERRPKEADARLPRGSHLIYSINNSSLSHSAWDRTHRAAWLPFPLRLLAHSKGKCHFRGLGCAAWRRNFAFFKVLAFKNYYLFKIAISQTGNSSATLPMKT